MEEVCSKFALQSRMLIKTADAGQQTCTLAVLQDLLWGVLRGSPLRTLL